MILRRVIKSLAFLASLNLCFGFLYTVVIQFLQIHCITKSVFNDYYYVSTILWCLTNLIDSFMYKLFEEVL